MYTEAYEVEDTYLFDSGQRVTVRVTLSDFSPENLHPVLAKRRGFGKAALNRSTVRVTSRKRR